MSITRAILSGFAFTVAACGSCDRADERMAAPTPPQARAPSDTTTPPPAADSQPTATTQRAEDVAVAVEHLLESIRSSTLGFVRNGTEHSGPDAAAHLQRKYEHYRDEIARPEDFIAKAATQSETTGKPYMVKLADDQQVPLAKWLTTRLAEWRAAPER